MAAWRGRSMSVDTELLALAREVQACDVRLALLPPGNGRRAAFRSELEERRASAAERLATLEAEHGWQPEEPPPAA
jgi:hypothetical protein